MKKGINYILLNSAFLIFIIYVLFKLNILIKIEKIFILIFPSIILSYIIYPIYKKINNKLNKTISIIIVYILLLLFIFILIYLIIPRFNFINKVIDLSTNILKFEKMLYIRNKQI